MRYLLSLHNCLCSVEQEMSTEQRRFANQLCQNSKYLLFWAVKQDCFAASDAPDYCLFTFADKRRKNLASEQQNNG
jgi:hypothetical protein